MTSNNVCSSSRIIKGVLKINDKSFAVFEGHNTIGRAKAATIIIKNIKVSQQHALITVIDDKHYISEIKAENGTSLNQSKLQPLRLYELHDESILKFADVEGVYRKVTDEHPFDKTITEQSQQFSESIFYADTQADVCSNGFGNETTICSINEMETQQLSRHERIFNSTDIHDAPTQLLCGEIELEISIGQNGQESPDCKSSNESLDLLGVPAVEEEEIEASQLQVDQLHKRVRRGISSDDEELKEENPETTEREAEVSPDSPVHTSQLGKKKQQVINSDSETDIEDNVEDTREEVPPLELSPKPDEDGNDTRTDIIVRGTPERNNRSCADSIVNSTIDESITIPATQEPQSNNCDTKSQTCESQKSANSSEAFQLGLTQLMESETPKSPDPGAETAESGGFASVLNDHVTESNGNVVLLEADARGMKKAGLLSPANESDDVYLRPTQKFTSAEDTNDMPGDDDDPDDFEDDLFNQPTQRFTTEVNDDTPDDDSVYMVPTQTISDSTSVFLQDTQPNPHITPENDRTVQKWILGTRASANECDGDDIYMQPTQKFEMVSAKTQTEEKDTQLEVFFSSQTVKVTEYEDSRPANPLLDIFQGRATLDESDEENDNRHRSVFADKWYMNDVHASEARTTLEERTDSGTGVSAVWGSEESVGSRMQTRNSKRMRDVETKSRRGRTSKKRETPAVEFTSQPSTSSSGIEKIDLTSPQTRKRRANKPALVPNITEKLDKKRKVASSRTAGKKQPKSKSPVTSLCRSRRNEMRNPGDVLQSTDVLTISSATSDEVIELYRRNPKRGGAKGSSKLAADKPISVDSSKRLDSGDASLETSSSGNEVCYLESAARLRRQTKPQVVFTMMDDPELNNLVRNLGGRVAENVTGNTVLVSKQIRRSQKMLVAIGEGVPICSPNWLLESKRANKFLDPWNYIVDDKEAEKKWKFTVRESLKRSQRKKLLEGYSFLILVTTAVDVLKAAIKSNGGKFVTNSQVKVSKNFVIIANVENKAKLDKFLQQKNRPLIVGPEAIFDGVLRQELQFDRHLIPLT